MDDREWKVKKGYKEKGVGSEKESQGEGKYGILGGDWERRSETRWDEEVEQKERV